jgi:hypothetical protein
MVGEVVVEPPHDNNALQESAGKKASLKPNGNFEPFPHQDIEPYERTGDGARMVAIAPGEFVNEKLLAAMRLVPFRQMEVAHAAAT